jgi:hypothetical protein
MSYEASAPELIYGEYELVGPRVGFNDIVLDIDTAGLLRDMVAQEFLPVVNSSVLLFDETQDKTIGRASAIVMTDNATDPQHFYIGAHLTHRLQDTWKLTLLSTQFGMDDIMNKDMVEYRLAASDGMVMEAAKRTRSVIDMAAICIEDVLNNKVDILRREAVESPINPSDIWEAVEVLDMIARHTQAGTSKKLDRYLP